MSFFLFLEHVEILNLNDGVNFYLLLDNVHVGR